MTLLPERAPAREQARNDERKGMHINRVIATCLLFLTALAGSTLAQEAAASQWPAEWIAARRHLLAVTYDQSRITTVTMKGKAIAPRVIGKAEVEYRQGRMNVRLEMDRFENPQSIGALYTTYILWAVAPEGRVENLMELPIQRRFRVESATKFLTFGLMITAEPHPHVGLPSSLIVAENTLRKGAEGRITTSTIDYRGDPGMFYVVLLPDTPSTSPDFRTPLIILGARRAVEIAERAGARQFAAPEFNEAQTQLVMLEQDWPRLRRPSNRRINTEKNGRRAHDVMRLGEQARKLSVERVAKGRNAAQAQDPDSFK